MPTRELTLPDWYVKAEQGYVVIGFTVPRSRFGGVDVRLKPDQARSLADSLRHTADFAAIHARPVGG